MYGARVISRCAVLVIGSLTEVLHFDQYSGSSPTMSEEDFARVLLRHTTWDLDPVFKRLRGRPPSLVSYCHYYSRA